MPRRIPIPILLCLAAALAGGACEDLALEDQAFRCETDADCLHGRVCVAGACREPGAAGADTVTPASCEDGVCRPDQTQREGCGACGTRERTCGADCAWGPWGACEGEGECVPGEPGGRGPCGACGTQPLVCGATCAWEPDGACEGEGDCAPGAEDTLPCERCGVRRRACGDDCAWGPWGLCEDQGACEVGDGESEGCGDCGTRARLCDAACAWTAWSACQDEGECAAGDEETEACGACGTRSRRCRDVCRWDAWSACEGEGECAAGDEETEACGNCGARTRVCAETCAWGDWSECVGEGPCVALTEETEGCAECGERTRSCTATCRWTAWSACADEPFCETGEQCAAHGVCVGRRVAVTAVGAFPMGSPTGEGEVDEQPEHDVAVAGFAVDRYEVTAAEFAAFLNVRGNDDGEGHEYLDLDDPDAPIEQVEDLYAPKAACQDAPDGPHDRPCGGHPVFEVSWYGAHDFCAWRGGRLPTEAEWERVAAGAVDLPWPWGAAAPDAARANCAEAVCADGFLGPAPVGSFPGGATGDGVEDLAGNVLEWVADWYHPGYAGAPTDGSAWVVPPSTQRVARGGHASSPAADLRAAARHPFPPSQTPDTPLGFRCVYD